MLEHHEAERRSKDKDKEKRRQVPLPTDLTLPEFSSNRLTTSAKGMLFFVAEWLGQVEQVCSARLPDEVTINKKKLSAGSVYFDTVVNYVVWEEFSRFVKNRTHRYDSEAEAYLLRQIEKTAFSDVSAWFLSQLQKILPESLTKELGKSIWSKEDENTEKKE